MQGAIMCGCVGSGVQARPLPGKPLQQSDMLQSMSDMPMGGPIGNSTPVNTHISAGGVSGFSVPLTGNPMDGMTVGSGKDVRNPVAGATQFKKLIAATAKYRDWHVAEANGWMVNGAMGWEPKNYG